MSDSTDDDEEIGVLIAAKDAALKPLRYATSKPARRIYISTVLFLITSLLLLGTAILAYVLFYYSYIPTRGFTRPIHLQFSPDSSHPPFGTASLDHQLISEQLYDVSVLLYMPRTPSNKAAGNFMLDLQLLGPASAAGAPPTIPGTFPSKTADILLHSRRPAILTYYSDTMEHVHRAAGLLWYVLGLRHEAETLVVPMLERAEFARGWRNVPDAARLELHGGAAAAAAQLQVYSAHVRFTARLRGLRWLMYNYRVTTFMVMTTAFWAVEIAGAAAIWALLAFVLFPPRHGDGVPGAAKPEPDVKHERRGPIKREEQDLSSPLSAAPRIKSEDDAAAAPPLSEIPPLGTEADVEDADADGDHVAVGDQDDDEDEEDADFVLDEPSALLLPLRAATGGGATDSGIGTSLESGIEHRPAGVRRRRSSDRGG